MARKLRSVEHLLAPAVAETIDKLTTAAEDAGAIALAKRYAREIDEAAVIRASLTKALRELEQLDQDLHDKFLTLAVQIEETAVLGNLGPKLLATLEQLGATPAARAKLRGGGAPSGGPSRLEAARQARASGA